MPVESGPYAPLLFLVPHLSMQKFHYSVSLINIVTVLNSLLIAAWTDKEELRREMTRVHEKENEFQRRLVLLGENDKKQSITSPASPVKPHTGVRRQGTMGAMTFTTISPKNQFKKLLTLVKDKEMSMGTCSWTRAFQNVKRHKLFQLRQVTTLVPFAIQAKRKKQEELLRLQLHLHKYRAYESALKNESTASSAAINKIQIN